MKKLSPKQQRFYETLISYVRKYFRWPTYKELAELLDAKSENTITRLYKSLLENEYLRKDGQGQYTFTNPTDVWLSENEHSKSIPVLGEISAGSLHEAIEADLGEITIKDFFPNDQNVFALRVRGLSMKGLGLSTGDIIILSKTELRNGDVGSVLYNGETTLKRAYKKDGQVRLVPANPDYDDIIIEPGEFEEVTVLGKYLGHLNDDGLVKSPY